MRGVRPKTLQILGGNSWGGGCVLIREYVGFLLQKGWEVHLLSSHPEVISKMSEVEGLVIIDDIELPRDPSPVQHFRGLKEVTKLCLKAKYDVVQTYNTLPGLVGRLAARLARVPAIFHHQAGWNLGPFYSKASWMLNYPAELIGLTLSTKSICCSETIRRQADEYRLFPKAHLTTICNGIDPEPFSMERPSRGKHFRVQLQIPEAAVVVGCHGRLSDLKNNETLVRALAKLIQSSPETQWHLALAGDGSEKDNLVRLAHDLSVQDRVHLLGYCTDIPDFLASIDIFAMASLREGMSISVMEAMAAAKPIICSSIPQNIELIPSEEFGITVSPQDSDAFAASILDLWQNPDVAQSKGKAACRRLTDQYSLQQFLDQTYQLYLSVSADRGNVLTDAVALSARS